MHHLRARLTISLACLLQLAGCSADDASDSSRSDSPESSLPKAAAPAVVDASATPSTNGVTSGASSVGAIAAPTAPSDGDEATTDLFAGPASPPSTSGSTTNPVTAQAGVLTAGTWDDNRNFARFSAYRSALLQARLPGAMPTSDDEHAAAHIAAAAARGPRRKLDVALVVDTTGSMGDEISYLQTEFLQISNTIGSLYPNADQHWALVLYRDTGDEYLVRAFDFDADAETFRTNLAKQYADGGGDIPESPDAALAKTATLAWRTGNDVARLAFWLADAPHHAAKASAMADAVRASQALDVHYYPVASSGVDDLTELTMRSTAQLTLGRYMFLTNDSGVGGDHKEPTIPCYFVTHLNDAILRMVDVELSGVYREPTQSELIRTGGNPKDGACTLSDGQTAQTF